jgi:excisionase family DNA binding protein
MLTFAEAAEQLGIASSTLRHQVQVGRLKARLLGKAYVVTDREVSRYRATSLGKPGRPSDRSAPPVGR